MDKGGLAMIEWRVVATQLLQTTTRMDTIVLVTVTEEEGSMFSIKVILGLRRGTKLGEVQYRGFS